MTSGRVIGYDIARAFATCGMVRVNFKVVMGAETNGPGWLTTLAGVVDGKAAATFVVLAGVGISLMTRRARASRDAASRLADRGLLLKRAAFLFVVGIAYYPIWPGDILHFYGIYLALAALLLWRSDRELWIWTALAVVGFLVLLAFLDYERGWDWDALAYTDFWTPAGMARHLFFNGFHPVLPWIAFLIAGMWLGRRDVTDERFRRRLLAAGVAMAVLGSLIPAGLLRVLDPTGASEDRAALLGTGPIPPMPTYVVVGLGAAFATIAISVALGLRFGDRGPTAALVATGQLSLTLYVAHVMIGMVALALMGRLEGQTLAFSLAATAIFCGLAILFAWAWRRRFARGPLETIMRATTG